MNKSDLAKIRRALKNAELEIQSGKKMGKVMDHRELYDPDPIPTFRETNGKSIHVTNTATEFNQRHPFRWGNGHKFSEGNK